MIKYKGNQKKIEVIKEKKIYRCLEFRYVNGDICRNQRMFYKVHLLTLRINIIITSMYKISVISRTFCTSYVYDMLFLLRSVTKILYYILFILYTDIYTKSVPYLPYIF